jgi:hypothetical protein
MSISKRSGHSSSPALTVKIQEAIEHFDGVVAILPGVLAPKAPEFILEAAALFRLEQVAWELASVLESLCFELKLGPGSAAQPAKCIDMLVRDAGLPIGTGRRLKQVLEYRNLSQRPRSLLDVEKILDGDALGSDRDVLVEFGQSVKEFLGNAGKGSAHL